MTTTTTPSKLAVIFAGEELPAIMLDGSSVQVRVRAMPARHLGKVLATCTDEAALLDLVCSVPSPVDDKEERLFAGWQPVPANWADNLDDKDPGYAKLLETAKRLNFSRAAAWGERQIAAKQFQAKQQKILGL